ncbi:MAG: NAD(P)H-binding protein [Spirochaetaceae bacterium]|nr:NAD(P)H-binding protein [Spirochaetaceae bacterium]
MNMMDPEKAGGAAPPARMTVLVLGATGRTGRLLLRRLLEEGAEVRAPVRSASRLPRDLVGHPRLAVIEVDLTSLPDEALRDLARGCGAVVSCLGHTISLRGVFGPPRNLVTRTVARLCDAIKALGPAQPVRFALMSSVSVNAPGGVDARRGAFEKARLWVIRALVPPAADNQRAADFLRTRIAADDPGLQWVVVRPDTLVEGAGGDYALHEGIVSSLAKPDRTAMANVASFLARLALEPRSWEEWKGRMPVIVG